MSVLVCLLLFLSGAPFAYYGGEFIYGGVRILTDTSSSFLHFSLFVGFAVVAAGAVVVFLGVAHAWVAAAMTDGRMVARPAGLLLSGTAGVLIAIPLLRDSVEPIGAGSGGFQAALPWLVIGAESVSFVLLLVAGRSIDDWLRHSGHAGNAIPTTVALGQAMSYFYVIGALGFAALIAPLVSGGSGTLTALVIGSLVLAVLAALAARRLASGSTVARILICLLAVADVALTALGVVRAGDIATAGLLFPVLLSLAWGPTTIGLLWFGAPAVSFSGQISASQTGSPAWQGPADAYGPSLAQRQVR